MPSVHTTLLYIIIISALITAFSVTVLRAEEGALEFMERSRDAGGAVYPGKDLLAEIKRELLRNNNAAAKRLLERARGTYGRGSGEILLLGALLDVMEHNYRGALASIGGIRADIIDAETARLKKAEKDATKLKRTHGGSYGSSFAAGQSFTDGVYLPDRNLIIYSAGGTVYRRDTRTGARTEAARIGEGRTMGMTASFVPEITAVSVKTGGRYVIRVFSEAYPAVAANLEKKIASGGNNITPFISMDGHTFLFASDRSSSRGGFDIFLSTFSNGAWSDPVNVGYPVNTRGDDINPWLHPDRDTLFFSSNGHEGFGGHDIYAMKLSSGEGPFNLGLPINDIYDQSTQFSVDLEGGHLYRSAEGRVSKVPVLYSVDPASMRIVHGRITMDGKAADKSVIIKADTNDGTLGATESMSDGRYSLAVPYGRDFTLMPVSPGFLLHTQDLDGGKGGRLIHMDFNLPRVYRGMKMQYMINFDPGKAEITNREKGKLKELIRVLQDNPHIRFEISGHSSGLGTQARVERISRLRVAAIMDYLLEGNVNPKRLTIKAYGGEKKLDAGDAATAAQRSRRVEINIISWDEDMEAVTTGDMRGRLVHIQERLELRRKINFALPAHILAGASLACFGAGGYYTYRSLGVKSDYEALLQEYRDIPLASWKVQSADAYQQKLDKIEDEYDRYRKYSIYAYAAGGTLAVGALILYVSEWFNQATIHELEKEAETIQRISFDFKFTPTAQEFAFTYRF